MIKVVIVDDKQINRNTLQEKLRAQPDVSVLFTAINGRDFLEKMKEAKDLPDVVFMDIEMPLMDGIETVGTASVVYPDVKFVMLTIFDDDDKIFEAIKFGAVGYLLKDENPEKLIQSLKEVVEMGGAPMSPRIARKSLQIMTKGETKKTSTKTDNPLSDRELEILQKLVEGKDYKKIAYELFLSPYTIRTHITNIYKKIHVNNRAQAVNLSIKKGWFSMF